VGPVLERGELRSSADNAARQAVPVELNETIDAGKFAMVAGRDVPWLLRSRAEQHGDKPFLIWEPFTDESRTWSYAAFRVDVLRVAAGLAERGVGFGERVLVHLDNSPEFVIAWFACAEIGAVAVSTNTRSVARDMTYFAEHAEVIAAITSPKFAALVHSTAPSIRFLALTDNDAGDPASAPADIDHVPWDELIASDGEAPERPVDPMADLGIQFTSGTTSRPKAVLWTHANVVYGAEVSCAHMRLQPSDVTLTFLPLFHTNAQSYSMLSTLWSGGTMVVQPRFSASRFWPISVKHQATWSSLIPFCVKALAAHPVPPDHAYRFWGPAVRLPDVEQLLGIKTLGWWGMTETITQGIVGSLDHPDSPLSIGRPSPAFEINVLHPDGTPIGPGERGHLFIRGVRGVQMFKEYYKNPEATAAAFDADGWFDTGDLISMGENGDLFFSDRLKDMLKIGAENVAASEIESVIMQSGLAGECAVVGQPHFMLDEVPVAFVIPSAAAGPDAAEAIRAYCAENLADFKVPFAVHLVDELPRSTLEKIAKAELRKTLPTIEV
jgi:crotonobetaine/carnitine-CoA ligase